MLLFTGQGDYFMKINKVPYIAYREGKKIVCTAFRKDDNVCSRLVPVIISHGFTSDQSKTEGYAVKLAEAGYAAFTFDFIGGGFHTKSDGEMTDMTVLSEVEDLKAVIEALRSRPALDMDRLVLMGCSQGGFVSGLTAAELKDAVHRLVMLYPALCIPDDARRGSMQMLKFDPENIPDIIEAGPVRLSGEYARCMLDMDACAEISGYDGPVLIIHGDADEIVPYHYAEDAYRAYTEKRGTDTSVRLIILPGAPHGFYRSYFDTACSEIVEFLRED